MGITYIPTIGGWFFDPRHKELYDAGRPWKVIHLSDEDSQELDKLAQLKAMLQQEMQNTAMKIADIDKEIEKVLERR